MLAEFILTERCNWQCKYCQYPLIENPKHLNTIDEAKELDWLYDYINNNPKYDGCVLEGGEIGLVPIEVVLYMLEKLNKKCIINTNGVFIDEVIKNGIDISKYTDTIWWHCVPNPNGDIIEDKAVLPGVNVIPGIVGNSVDNIIKFVTNNKHIKFGYLAIENDLGNRVNIEVLRHEYEQLLDFVNKNKDMFSNTDDIIMRTVNSIKAVDRYDRIRSICRKCSTYTVINVPNKQLSICAVRSNSNRIELNVANLEKIDKKKHNPFDPTRFDNCDTCIRECISGYNTAIYNMIGYNTQ